MEIAGYGRVQIIADGAAPMPACSLVAPTRLGWAMRTARKVTVAVVGGAVLAVGIALVVLPGPAFLVIPLGLAILAREFPWARRLLRRARLAIARAVRAARRLGRRQPAPLANKSPSDFRTMRMNNVDGQ